MSTGPDPRTVALVLDRDRRRCVVCSWPLQGERGFDWVLHHRRPRAMGGTRRTDANSASNLLTLCTECHESVESHRTLARRDGLLLPQYADPAASPVLIRGERWCYLTADGTYSDDPPDTK